MKKRSFKVIDKIISHISDSPYDHHDDISVIRQWHLERGFSDVGYHYFIKRNGEIQGGRSIKRRGADCLGQNYNSVGVCLHGMSGDITQKQFKSLTELVIKLKIRIDGISEVGQHSDYDKRKPFCAGLDKDKIKYLTNLVK